jgi:hypothetical protein
MRSNLVRALLASVALALATAGAFAGTVTPIQGTPVGLEGDPGSIIVADGVTNSKGQVDLGILAPGKYVLVIDGKKLAIAIAKLAASNLVRGTGATISVDSGTELTLSTIVANGAQLELEHGKLSIPQTYRPGKDARFAFKIADNESPRPQDRLFRISVTFPDASPR